MERFINGYAKVITDLVVRFGIVINCQTEDFRVTSLLDLFPEPAKVDK